MREPQGRFIAMSPLRRFVGDLVHFARKVPLITVQRHMRLAALVEARQSSAPRPGWAAIFLKAFGLVAAHCPELRRAYLPWPWPHIYEHPRSVASVAIERHFRGEFGVVCALLPQIENKTIPEISTLLHRYKEGPLEQFGIYRRILRVSRLPLPLRRLLWWLGLNISGRFRARYFGTFGLTVVAGLGTSIQSFLSPLASAFTYDVFAADGSVDVRLTFDHRVLDAGTAARALADLERVLLDDIRIELTACRDNLAA